MGHDLARHSGRPSKLTVLVGPGVHRTLEMPIASKCIRANVWRGKKAHCTQPWRRWPQSGTGGVGLNALLGQLVPYLMLLARLGEEGVPALHSVC